MQVPRPESGPTPDYEGIVTDFRAFRSKRLDASLSCSAVQNNIRVASQSRTGKRLLDEGHVLGELSRCPCPELNMPRSATCLSRYGREGGALRRASMGR